MIFRCDRCRARVWHDAVVSRRDGPAWQCSRCGIVRETGQATVQQSVRGGEQS